MVKIRLFRTGARKRPSYRVVAIDSRRARQGRFLENLGTYDPSGREPARLDTEAIERWVARGAQLSDTVRSLLKRQRRAGAEAGESVEPAATPS
jgi:small subunit ribosomal protein S16